MTMPAWEYPGDPDFLEYDAFVYRIWHVASGRAYIGYKTIWGTRGGKRRVSDYPTYWGSNEELRDEIAQLGHGAYRREIIRFVKHRKDALYYEEMAQFQHDVLKATLADGSRAFYNNSIGRRFYAPRGDFHDLKKKYKLKPLKCICSKDVPFAKRHTRHCSARCLKQFTQGLNEVPKDEPTRTKRSSRKVPGRTSHPAPGKN